MGFFDSLSDAVNEKAEQVVKAYTAKLRNASDSAVISRWEYVCNNDEIDYRMREATENEMRRRGLL